MNDNKLTLVEHLEEMRRRLIISLIAIIVGTIVCIIFWQDIIYSILMAPLDELEEGLFLLSVTEGFYTQIKTAFIGGLIISSPIVLWQIILFLLPALYKNEKKIFWCVFITSVLLFVLGVGFAYKYVLILGLKFLLVDFSGGLTPMISAAKYISFVITFLFPFGIVFEIPVVTYVLTKKGIITSQSLRKKRQYVVLIIFILAAALTPPDIISQVMLALPMLLLYEISIIISILIDKRKKT
ncbi:MAG: twin-arginine translocase subunit TatC [Clostridia bacterium]|nr:twin-arginine translocase subunit TatC [Clostridia bacterium]MDD4048321.1 twin-arginine translocase subunit TatC [Clostridia bacterium]